MWHTHQHSAVVRSEVVALRATAFDHTAELLTDLAAHVCVCVCVCVCVRVCVCLVVDGVSAPHTSLHGQVSLVEVVALTRAHDACLTHAFSTHCQHVSTLIHNRREELHSRAHPRLSHACGVRCQHNAHCTKRASCIHTHASPQLHTRMWCAGCALHTAQKSCTRSRILSYLTHARAAATALCSTLMHTVRKSCTRGQTGDCLTHSRVVALVLLLLLLLLLRYANAGRRHNWLTRRLVL
jgi:hypothetical protein